MASPDPKDIKDSTKLLQDQVKVMKQLHTAVNSLVQSFSGVANSVAPVSDALERSRKLIDETNNLAGKLDDNIKNVGTELYKQLEVNKAIVAIDNELDRLAEIKNTKSNKLNTYQKQLIDAKVTELEVAKDILNNQEKAVIAADKMHERIVKQQETFTKYTKLLKEPSKIFENLGHTIEHKVSKQFHQALADPKAYKLTRLAAGIQLAVVTTLIAGIHRAVHLQEEVNDISKEFGTTYKESYKVLSNLEGMTIASGIIGANTKDALAAYSATSAILGTNAKLTQDQLNAQLFLTKQLGFSADESAAIALNAEATDGSFHQQFAAVEGIADQYNKLAGDNVNVRNVTKQVLKTSNSLKAAYKNNSKELTMAVVQAGKLGMSLERTSEISKGYLDVESSIANEMEARVLTGKNINLNEARYLALQGKSAEAVASAVKGIGGYEELSKMLPFQQDALAKAMNMTTDELLQQAKLSKLGIKDMKNLTAEEEKRLENAAAIGDADAKQLMKQKQITTAQERIADLGEKLLIVFDKLVAGPISGLLNGLNYVLDPVTKLVSFIGQIFTGATSIKDVFKEMGTVLTTFVGTFATLLGLQQVYMAYQKQDLIIQTAKDALGKAQVVWETAKNTAATAYAAIQKGNLLKTIGEAAMKAFASAASVPVVGPLLGAAAAAGAVALGMKYMSDGVIGPDGGMVVSGQKGSISLDPNDSIVAGTNLFGGGSSTESTVNAASVGNDPQIAEMIGLLKQLIATTSGPTVIKIGSRTIEELDSQIGLRKNYSTVVDSSYGNRI
jgi:hypothetical protein